MQILAAAVRAHTRTRTFNEGESELSFLSAGRETVCLDFLAVCRSRSCTASDCLQTEASQLCDLEPYR